MRTQRGAIGTIVLLAGLVGLGWGIWPAPQVTHTLEISPAQMVVPGDAASAVMERRRMTLIFPAWLRAGETAQVRMTFEPLPAKADLPQKVDVTRRYAVFTRASLDLPGLEVTPAGPAGQILSPGKPVTFWWVLEGAQAGNFDGTAWLSLRFDPLDGREPLMQALAAPRMNVKVRRFLGLGGPAGRFAGGAAGVVGLLLLVRRR